MQQGMAAGRVVKLKDVVQQVKDRVSDPKAAGLTHYVPGGGISADNFRIREWLPVDDGLMGPAFHMRFRTGHTLYKSRVPHGVAVADRDGLCANTTYVLTSHPEVLLPRLLPFVLSTQSFRQFEIEHNRGSTNLFLNFSDIAEYQLVLPPLEEQRRICDALTAVEDATGRLHLLRQAALTLRDSYSSQAFLTDLPLAPLSALCGEITVGIVVKPAQWYVDDPKGIPALIMKNVQRGWLDLTDMVRISDAGHRAHSKSTLRCGDVVAIRSSGSASRTGDAAVVPPELDGANCIDLLISRPGPDLAPEYLRDFLNAPTTRSRLVGNSSGTMQKHLNVGAFRSLEIPLRPLDEQKTISATLDAVVASVRQCDNRHAELLSIRETLYEALTGAQG